MDAIVAGIGTGGTLTGIARTLKPRRPGLRIVGVEPRESAVLSAGDDPGPHDIQGIGAGFCPGVLDLAALDGVERTLRADFMANLARARGRDQWADARHQYRARVTEISGRHAAARRIDQSRSCLQRR